MFIESIEYLISKIIDALWFIFFELEGIFFCFEESFNFSLNLFF
tara:strand:- start:609 stop:740 length:132 start_codon:yes stop_codon:yes gene_type:complete